jgi:hypothetical protein
VSVPTAGQGLTRSIDVLTRDWSPACRAQAGEVLPCRLIIGACPDACLALVGQLTVLGRDSRLWMSGDLGTVLP